MKRAGDRNTFFGRIKRTLACICCVLAGLLMVAVPLPSPAKGESDWIGEFPLVTFTYENGVMRIDEGTRVISSQWDWASHPERVDPFAIEIPASVEKIAEIYIFASFSRLKEFRVAEANQYFQSVEGALYTKDGTQLLSFPQARGGTHHMPPGAVQIEWNAFGNNTRLKEIVLAEGMAEVHLSKFESLSGLTKITLPTTFEKFLVDSYYTFSSLTDIGVAEGSEAFKEIDGVLFAKDGTLVKYPWGRKDAHYDVPDGTTGIGENAFDEHQYIQSISLPRSVTWIGKRAFAQCTALTTVSLPATMQTVDMYAFASCIHLSRCSVPLATKVGEGTFANCPKLPFGENESMSSGFEYERQRQQNVYGILSPENARDSVPVYASASASSEALIQLQCGATIKVLDEAGSYYRIEATLPFGGGEATEKIEGFVKKEALQVYGHLYGLLPDAEVQLSPGQPPAILHEGMWSAPETSTSAFRLEEGEAMRVFGQYGQYYGVGYTWEMYYVFANEVTLVAKTLPEGKTYGIVVNEDRRDRLHLREKPNRGSESLGKYFSGTQVEILDEEGEFYRVKLDFREGYMMKQYVRVVEEMDQGL